MARKDVISLSLSLWRTLGPPVLQVAALLALTRQAALSVEQLLFQQGHLCRLGSLQASYLPLPVNDLQTSAQILSPGRGCMS